MICNNRSVQFIFNCYSYLFFVFKKKKNTEECWTCPRFGTAEHFNLLDFLQLELTCKALLQYMYCLVKWEISVPSIPNTDW